MPLPDLAMRRSLVVLSLALFGATLALPAAAQWKWRGANGQIQYSDLPPPPGTPDKDILQRPANAKMPIVVSAPAVATAASALPPKPAASKPEPDSAEQKKRAEEEKAQKAKEEQDARRVAEQKRDNCARAQESLRTLQSGQRITKTNAQGERIFLDESQTAAELQRTRALIASECR